MPDDDDEKCRASKPAREIGSGFWVKYNLIKKSPTHQPPKQSHDWMEKYGNDKASTPHLFCERFLKGEYPERGAEFREVEERLRRVIQLVDNALVEVVRGIDGLCRARPHCRANRCWHPRGDEEAVRKWDGIILRALGIPYGETRTTEQRSTLLKEKAPLDFCQTRCPSRSSCTVTRLGIDT